MSRIKDHGDGTYSVTVPHGLYNELRALEVDTLEEDDTSSSKAHFVAAHNDAKRTAGGMVLRVNQPALHYMARETGAFGNTADILHNQAEGGGAPGKRAMARVAERLQQEAHQHARRLPGLTDDQVGRVVTEHERHLQTGDVMQKANLLAGANAHLRAHQIGQSVLRGETSYQQFHEASRAADTHPDTIAWNGLLRTPSPVQSNQDRERMEQTTAANRKQFDELFDKALGKHEQTAAHLETQQGPHPAPEQHARSLQHLNQILRKEGMPKDVELVRGRGYYYFTGNTHLPHDEHHNESETVGVFNHNHMTVDQWKSELQSKIKAGIIKPEGTPVEQSRPVTITAHGGQTTITPVDRKAEILAKHPRLAAQAAAVEKMIKEGVNLGGGKSEDKGKGGGHWETGPKGGKIWVTANGTKIYGRG